MAVWKGGGMGGGGGRRGDARGWAGGRGGGERENEDFFFSPPWGGRERKCNRSHSSTQTLGERSCNHCISFIYSSSVLS